MKSKIRQLIAWTVPAVILIMALVYAFAPKPVLVDLGRVTRGSLVVTVNEEGRTRVKEVYVVSAPVPGKVLR
ncbi:MAG: efflux transporter periplasmic adaptor subunit, partial [Rhodospirillales bacterium]|nr:efflux transporter periplasmic adaptor subunit [Rhodospirillales bacterium]